MTFHQGKVSKYLWMTLEYILGDNFKVSMIDYINEIIAKFDKAESRGVGIKISTAPEDLYKVDEECEKLSPENAKMPQK